MDYVIKELKTQKKVDEYIDEIYNLIKKYDKEFVPPLLDINKLYNQNFIIARDKNNNNLIGFLSYYNTEIQEVDCNYITTIIVDKNYRRKGVAYSLYNEMFTLNTDLPIIVRTWSTNEKYINLLRKLDYVCFNVLKNNRGNGMDTMYFCNKFLL